MSMNEEFLDKWQVIQYRMVINYMMFWKACNFLLRKHIEEFFYYKAVSQY